MASIRDVSCHYQASFPCFGPQLISEWRLCELILETSSCKVYLGRLTGSMMTRPFLTLRLTRFLSYLCLQGKRFRNP